MQVHISMDEQLVAEIDQVAVEYGQSRSSLIRLWVRERMKKEVEANQGEK